MWGRRGHKTNREDRHRLNEVKVLKNKLRFVRKALSNTGVFCLVRDIR